MTTEPFRRGAKVSLAFRKNDIGPELRAVITKRIKPMLDYFSAELSALLMRRFESELDLVGEALEIAVSAYASEVTHAHHDRRADDPLPSVPSSTGRGLHDDEPRGAGRADPSARDRRPPQPAQDSREGRESDQPAPGSLTRIARDVLAANLGPDIAAMLDGPLTKLPEKGQTSDVPASEEAAESKSAAEAPVPEPDPKRGAPREGGNGVRICRNCGERGHYAKSCTRVDLAKPSPFDSAKARALAAPLSAISPTPRNLKPTAAAVELAKMRIEHKADRASASAAAAPAPSAPPPIVDDNPNGDLRWSPERRQVETTVAEGRKAAGELPTPSSSWVF